MTVPLMLLMADIVMCPVDSVQSTSISMIEPCGILNRRIWVDPVAVAKIQSYATDALGGRNTSLVGNEVPEGVAAFFVSSFTLVVSEANHATSLLPSDGAFQIEIFLIRNDEAMGVKLVFETRPTTRIAPSISVTVIAVSVTAELV